VGEVVVRGASSLVSAISDNRVVVQNLSIGLGAGPGQGQTSGEHRRRLGRV
jgi:hypothetical protein